MKLAFLGVGEACDETLANTSVWLQAMAGGVRTTVLLDCGFSVPQQYWRLVADAEDLNVVWLSHFHGDHFFGLPALLLRFSEMQRQSRLHIAGPGNVQDKVERAMELAYPGFLRKLTYPLEFFPAEAGQPESTIGGLQWRFAESSHGTKNLAVRIDDGKRSVFYSGDGSPTAESLSLARQCDLIIHEAFEWDRSVPDHCTVRGCVAFARKAEAQLLALVHVNRTARREHYEEITGFAREVEDLHVFLPESGDRIEL